MCPLTRMTPGSTAGASCSKSCEWYVNETCVMVELSVTMKGILKALQMVTTPIVRVKAPKSFDVVMKEVEGGTREAEQQQD